MKYYKKIISLLVINLGCAIGVQNAFATSTNAIKKDSMNDNAHVGTNIAQDNSSPQYLIQNTVNQVLQSIKNQKIGSLDGVSKMQKIGQIVDEKIMPNADLLTTTKMAVGPSWNKASEEQKTAIMKEFKKLLIITYSGALLRVNNQKVEYKPTNYLPTDTKVVVKSIIIEQGKSNSIDYKLHKVNDKWKVYDLNVVGVGLISSYKSEFAQQISNGGLDGLIKMLQAKNEPAK